MREREKVFWDILKMKKTNFLCLDFESGGIGATLLNWGLFWGKANILGAISWVSCEVGRLYPSIHN